MLCAMATLLVVHHTPSPTLREMLEAVLAGATDDAIEGVDVVTRAALTAGPVDVLQADGYILGTPANIGYMSGALKAFFDVVYYPCMGETAGRPYAAYVHGSSDTTGAIRAIDSIAGGIGWRQAHAPVLVAGTPGKADLEACWELGGAMAAGLMG